MEERIDRTGTPLFVQLYVEAKLKQAIAVFLASEIRASDAMGKRVLEIKLKCAFVFQNVHICWLYFKDKHP